MLPAVDDPHGVFTLARSLEPQGRTTKNVDCSYNMFKHFLQEGAQPAQLRLRNGATDRRSRRQIWGTEPIFGLARSAQSLTFSFWVTALVLDHFAA